MASAAPQKRMVSSVFITLATPLRTAITPHALPSDSRGPAPTSSVSSKSSHHTSKFGTPTASQAQPPLPHSHSSTTFQDPPLTIHDHTPSKSKIPPPTLCQVGSALMQAPPSAPSSSTVTTPKQTLHSSHQGVLSSPSGRSPGFTVRGGKAAGARESAIEDLPPPPPLPPPSVGTEPSVDSETPLPPPPPLPVSPRDAPQSVPQKIPVSDWQCGETAPPAGRSQSKPTPRNQGLREEEADAEGKDVCGFCRKPVALSEPAIEALNRTYHAGCFQCRQCCIPLAGQLYYNKAGIPLCEDCYQASLEQCWACGETIKEQVMRALGRAYHPPCFVCTTCKRPLGEERFAQGEVGEVYCLGDYYRKYAPCCSACQQLIVPTDDGRDSWSVECLGRTFHEDCFRCEICRVLLSPEPNEQGCYPLDGRVLCKPCHLTLVQEGQH